MKYKTDWTKPSDIKRKWYVIDVNGRILGRAATEIATLLIGKRKVEQVPNLDCGDFVIILNSDKIKLTRGKEQKKMYYRHSGYPGGFKQIRFDKQMAKNPNFVIEKAVTNMLPNNKLRSSMLSRLYVYTGEEHPHEAQKPEIFKLQTLK